MRLALAMADSQTLALAVGERHATPMIAGMAPVLPKGHTDPMGLAMGFDDPFAFRESDGSGKSFSDTRPDPLGKRLADIRSLGIPQSKGIRFRPSLT